MSTRDVLTPSHDPAPVTPHSDSKKDLRDKPLVSEEGSTAEKVQEDFDHLVKHVENLARATGPRRLVLKKEPVKPRSVEVNQFQAAIRSHALKLMGRSSNKDPFPLRAKGAKVAEWNPNGPTECCDVNSFLVDLDGTPKSDWNRSCGRVFEKSFRSDPNHEGWIDGPNVLDAWFTHLQHLIKTYRRSIKLAV
ncbi:hypothetical protein HWV62_20864 [Athelia sp. TMB]|nr:hypothetical protein HWV62_20864 [Athelia sp. TMB]